MLQWALGEWTAIAVALWVLSANSNNFVFCECVVGNNEIFWLQTANVGCEKGFMGGKLLVVALFSLISISLL